MKNIYQSGKYEIKYTGRGIVHANLTALQARAIFEIMKKDEMEFESIQLLPENS